MEVNWEPDSDACGTREDQSDDSSYVSEWAGQKAGLRVEVEGDCSSPSSPDCCPARPTVLPVELHCEAPEAHGMSYRWTESAAVGVFITSTTNFDLQCEDGDLVELCSSELPKGDPGMVRDHEDIVMTDLGTVQAHNKLHAAERSYRCPLCNKEFFHTVNLRMHRLVHSSDRPYKCPECDKGFVLTVDFWRHLRNVHQLEHPKALRNGSLGTECLVNLSQSSNDITEVCTDDTGREWPPKPYLCPTCGKGFRTSNLLSKHKVIHRQAKPYSCQECGKAFVQLLRLKRHQQIHTGAHPFYCEECGRSFTRLTSLQRHQRIHTGEKPYSCAYCAQDFTESGSLRRHERIHQLKPM